MLSIDECRKILGPKSKEYSDSEVESMRHLLTDLISEIIENLKQEQYEASSTNGKSVK